MITTILWAMLALALGLAFGARLRLWYYERRSRRQDREEFAAHARRDAIRGECDRIWWEGQR